MLSRAVTMSVLLEDLTVGVGDGCANRFADEAGWEGYCPLCWRVGTTTPRASMIHRWMSACCAAKEFVPRINTDRCPR